jgi:hypothetical protein
MNTQRAPLSDERFVLVFYGIDPSPKSAEQFFLAASEWFTDLGFPPDKLGIGGKGHSGKVGDYRRVISKLQKTSFSEVKDFSMYASKPNAFIPGEDYFVSANFARADPDGGYAVIALPRSRMTKEVWLPVAHKIVQNLRPAYGLAFNRELALGPVWYALGVCYGGDPVPTGAAYDEALNISRWCDTGMAKKVYRHGLLRDVYPWNFLTQSQLDLKVEGLPLQEWIQKQDCRGLLSQLTDDMFLWELTEEQIPEVRKVLWAEDAIFDWRKFLLETIVKDYRLDWEKEWQEMLPFLGKHPKKYFPLIVDIMAQAARDTDDDKAWFMKLYEFHVKEPIRKNPDLLTAPPNGPLPPPPGCAPGEPAKHSLRYIFQGMKGSPIERKGK